MTPTEEAAKLARKRANIEAQLNHIFPKIVHPDYVVASEAVREIDVLRAQLLVVYRAMLAERDEELKRLREAAIEAGASLMEAEDHLMMGNYLEEARDIEMRQSSLAKVQSSLALLRAALHPQEPTNEQ